ncbi:LOW QUALITY PROTEIN: Putative replication protein [Frankliniella fusca]|uniref:Replication protein n=1 Tax=Frankliniella fusca TaxID=407009 RepID=A0AAE1HF23_9NEOP|nr:LOW QUALITY PROTEIN: Putative replication protein [Frankliniella fusca]
MKGLASKSTLKIVFGSRKYSVSWKARQKELTAMVEQLDLPTFFITLSAADYHWPDLFRILAPESDIKSLSEKERKQLVQDNPIIVDTFFIKRVEALFEKVLIPKFIVNDYWFRVEYQHRGSPHVHGVIWLDGAPDVQKIENIEDEIADEVAKYFSEYVSTEHPNPQQEPALKHILVEFCEVVDEKQDLAELVNKVQMHTKFGYPKELSDRTKFIIDDKDNIELETKKNHPRVNRYNKNLLQIWRANIDISPVISKERLIAYLAKYITKSENKSVQFQQLLNEIINSSNENDSARRVIQRLFIKFPG